MSTISNAPMGFVDRIKTAAGVMTSGRVPNPLAQEPKDRSRAALVKELNEWCLATRKFWEPVFKRIDEEQNFAAGKQWAADYECEGEEDEPYIADRMQQMLNRNTASTYAKNPTPEAKAVERMVFEVWDESQESLAGAKAVLEGAQPIIQTAAAAQATGQEIPPPPPELQQALAIVKDYEMGMAEKALKAKIAKTASLLLEQQWRVQSPEFLASMKQLVTQVFCARVGFIKVMYQRSSATTGDLSEGEEQPIVGERVNLPVDQIANLQQRLHAMLEPDFDPEGPEAEETRLLMESLARKGNGGTSNPEQETTQDDDEGVVYDYLGARSVLIDRRCKCLREFVGARRIAHEIVMPVEEAEREYKVRLSDAGAVAYTEDGPGSEKAEMGKVESGNGDEDGDAKMVCIWHIEDKDTGLCYVVCDGVTDFLKEPYEPEPATTRFWSIVPMMFNVQSVRKNDPAKDITIYPRSHVRLGMPMQRDINQAGESLREHRVAARPYKVGVKSKFDDGDLAKLSGPRSAHDCIMLNNLNEGEQIEDYFQAGPVPDFHQELYATGPSDQALMLATGAQPANLGAQNPDETATGQSIAEGSRINVDNSNSGEIDFALSTLAQMSFEMLTTMPADKVKARVGRGAVWADLSAADVRNEIFMQIEAGSSGRPNQAMEMAAAEKAIPLLVQMMLQEGKSLEPLIKMLARIWNSQIDVDDLLKPAQVQPVAGPQPVAPVGTGQSQGPGGLPPGMSAPNIPQPGMPAQVAPTGPPLPPVSRHQVAATVNGG